MSFFRKLKINECSIQLPKNIKPQNPRINIRESGPTFHGLPVYVNVFEFTEISSEPIAKEVRLK